MMVENFDSDLTDEQVMNLSPENQLEHMRWWFHQNFEGPANQTPYESKEGDYIFAWGGPYDANEELDAKFGGIVEPDLVKELADELCRENWEWAPKDGSPFHYVQ